MSSQLEICNLALQKIGATKISDLAAEVAANRREAVECDLAYDHCRRVTIRSHPFNCTTKRSTLTASVTAPDWGFTKAYPLPEDCLGVFETNLDRRLPWRVEQRQLLADGGGTLSIRYGFNNEDPSTFDPLFTEALITRLAFQIVEPITQSTTEKDALLQEFLRLTRPDAEQRDAEESSGDELLETDWEIARK